jgi:hypothetical protein
VKSVPLDPWGHPYRLVIREKEGKPHAFVLSQGPDPDTKDDDIEMEVHADAD